MNRIQVSLGILASVLTLAGGGVVLADELDDLLGDRGSSASLKESDRFNKNWDQFLDDLAKREHEKAKESLASLQASGGYVSPERRDFIRLAGAVLHFGDSLEADKDAFRATYKQAVEDVQEVEIALERLRLEILNRQRKYMKSNQLPPAVQAGFDKRSKDLNNLLAERKKVRASMDAEAKDFEAARLSRLTAEVLLRVGKDDSEEDVVTGLILSASYLELVVDDTKIRAQGQRLAAKQEELDKAAKIYAAIAEQIEPLVAAGNGEEARIRLRTLIAKVETSEQTPFVKEVAVAKLEALSITVEAAKSSERERQAASAGEMTEISDRLEFLERKLAAAQDIFGSLIRSIEGFSEFTGHVESESDLEVTKAKLKEKVKFGVVSKEKLDNMVKAQAEHVGIMREVEVLQGADQLSVLQRARLANLHATAEAALSLLDGVAP
jgi:hypothetical protein